MSSSVLGSYSIVPDVTAGPSSGAVGGASAGGGADPGLAQDLISAHTTDGHLDAAGLASAVAAQGGPGGLSSDDVAKLAGQVSDQLRSSSMVDAFAFTQAWSGGATLGSPAGGATLGSPSASTSAPSAAQAPSAASGAGASSGTGAAQVTADQIRAIMPNAGDQADAYAGALNTAMAAHGIDTPQKEAAFLGQVSVESGQLQHTSENLNYSAKRLTQVWPHQFPTVASAQPYAHNPEGLANKVYAGINGNGDEASGDGYQFRGRGLMQTTGRANYADIGHENDPDSLTDPATAAESAASFWQSHGLNDQTDTQLNRADFNAVSRTVNGGTNGSADRWAAYQRALTALTPAQPQTQAPAQP